VRTRGVKTWRIRVFKKNKGDGNVLDPLIITASILTGGGIAELETRKV